jgi:hypothetical protein
MLFFERSFLAWTAASLALVLPQVSAQCNPLTGKSPFLVSLSRESQPLTRRLATCQPNRGLTKSEFSVDFTQQSALP